MSKKDFSFVIKQAASYLARQVQLDGSFVYWRDANAVPLNKRYNMLRHCGCVWAMAMTNKYYPSEALKDAIESASGFIRKNMVVCEAPEIKGEMLLVLDHGFAKLGGNALAYLAFEQAGKLEPRLHQGLVTGLGFFLTENAEIRFYKFSPHNGVVTDLVSEYYPGEAALALCLANQYELAEQLVRTLKVTRDKDIMLQDHWLMQALELLMHYCKRIPAENAEALQQFILQYYADIYYQIDKDRVYWGRNTPMACRAEGLLSYLAVLHSIGDVKTYIEVRVLLEQIITQLLQYQITEGALAGAFLDRNKARIDYTQHSLSVFLRYMQYQDADIL